MTQTTLLIYLNFTRSLTFGASSFHVHLSTESGLTATAGPKRLPLLCSYGAFGLFPSARFSPKVKRTTNFLNEFHSNKDTKMIVIVNKIIQIIYYNKFEDNLRKVLIYSFKQNIVRQ